MATKIEWVDESWNPVTGCTKISSGCAHCYAERMARRLAGRFGYPEVPNHFSVTLRPDRLDVPLKWRKPRTVFVCSMSDLFHQDVKAWFIHRVFETMSKAVEHTFILLTKRPERMAWFVDAYSQWRYWPLPNVWLGVTAENQATADERIPLLLQTPAAVRFVSVEPLLSEIDLTSYLHCGISWCIIGSESGPNARPMDEDWVRRLVTQCKQCKTPVFYKQKLTKGKKVSIPMLDGKQYIEFPQTTDKQNAS